MMVVCWQIVTLAVLLCIVCSISDTRFGVIPNRILLVFSIFAVLLNGLYYGLFNREGFAPFLLNFAIVAICAIGLYLLDLWAAGDAKFFVVLSLMFPFSFVNDQGAVLVAPMSLMIVVSFSCGFIYLVGEGLVYSIKERRLPIHLSRNVVGFLKNYGICCIYMSIVNSFLSMVPGDILQFNKYLAVIASFFLIVLVFRYPLFQSGLFLCVVGAFSIGLFFVTRGYERLKQFQIYPYIYLLIVSILRNISEQYNYQTINIVDLKPGMILSQFSVLRMSTSRIKGLPQCTTEDLRSRLTPDEVYSIKRWSDSAKGGKTVTIVKKVPFALFISISYVLLICLYLRFLIV